MLTIRKEQMKIFEQQREADFRARLFARLKQAAEDAGVRLSEMELARQLDRGLTSGRRFFSTERDLARYAELVLIRMSGWSGADHPAAVLELLASSAVPAARRLDNVEYWIAKTRRIYA